MMKIKRRKKKCKKKVKRKPPNFAKIAKSLEIQTMKLRRKGVIDAKGAQKILRSLRIVERARKRTALRKNVIKKG